jgi:hypothetical protein
MTRDELQQRLDKIDARVRRARASYFKRWGKEIDRMDWFERALELVDATGIDPIVALLRVDRDSPSDSFCFEKDVAEFKDMLDQ